MGLVVTAAITAFGAAPIASYGTGIRFQHDILDARWLTADEAVVVAGNQVVTVAADGTIKRTVTLEGCTASLSRGMLSPDGKWVSQTCMMVGEGGLFDATTGKRVRKLENAGDATFCGPDLWHPDEKLERIELATNTVKRFERGGAIYCANGNRITSRGELMSRDGALQEISEYGLSVQGPADDGLVVCSMGEHEILRPDGSRKRGPTLDSCVNDVVVDNGVWFISETYDAGWTELNAKKKFAPVRTFLGQSQGLGNTPPALAFRGETREPWSWKANVFYPAAKDPVATGGVNELFFFAGDDLVVCEQKRCTVLADPVRTVLLPCPVDDDDDGVSPSGQWLMQGCGGKVHRIDLRTNTTAETFPLSDTYGIAVYDDGRSKYTAIDYDTDETWLVSRSGKKETRAKHPTDDVPWPLRNAHAWTDDDGIWWTPRDFEKGDYWNVIDGFGTEVFVQTWTHVERRKGKTVLGRVALDAATGAWADGFWAMGESGVAKFYGADLTKKGTLKPAVPLQEMVVEAVGNASGSRWALRDRDARIHVYATSGF